MAIEHAQAPRGQHEQPGAGKQDPNKLDRQVALVARKAWRNRGNQHRRREYSGHHQDRDDEREKRTDRACDPVGVLALAARDERRVDRDEGCGERAFAKQILEKVGNAKRRVEGVGGVGLKSEVVRKDLEPDQPGETTDENARADQQCSATRAALGWSGRWNHQAVSAYHARPAWLNAPVSTRASSMG